MNFLGLLVESYGTWLLLQRLVDASKDSDIPKNVPFAFAINNRNTHRVRLFSLVPLVWESNPKLQGGWCKAEPPARAHRSVVDLPVESASAARRRARPPSP